jgi:DNA-binding SARP family transcriptional activator
MRVALLGPFELGADARVGPRDRVVLSVLVLRRGRTVTAEVLADALWPEEQPVSWPKVVQGCVSRLRRMLGAETIETNPAGYRLRAEGISFDVDEFEDLVARGRAFAEEGSPERAAALLEQALDLWRGRPFDALEEWSPGRLEAARLTELRLAVQEERLAARLAAGHHVEVAAEGTVLVGEEPWRERRWAILALAQYRSGRQAEALATIRTARRRLGSQFGLDPGSDLVELERAILGQDPSLAADHDARQTSSECPWRGLASYEAEDRETFFGRDAEVDACLARLDASPLLVLAGPSGSGKSSLMKAGVAPALRLSGHTVVTFSPGPDPAAAMGAARAGVGGDPVLCVDQFEEAFAGGGDRVAVVAWLGEVAQYAEHRAPVILTVRADYLPEFALEPGFARLAERGLYLVAPLAGDSLRAAIEGPARVAGVRLEHGLVDLLMRDAEDQPGALPLLSHALAETWSRREGSLLTVEGYQESGGISGAVAASADRLHQSLSEDGRAQLRWLMLRMGSLAEHGEPVRTPMSHGVASGDPERARVLDLLVRSRLVISDQGSFDLAHEALIRAWPRLRGWLEEDREGQRLWRHLAAASAEWDALGRPASELYSGVRLEAARQWASQPTAQPTPLEQDFLDASLARAAADREELARQTQQQRRQNRRLRSLLAGGAAMLVLALVAALLAVDQGRTAADQRDSARAARQAAQHESLVGRSLTLRSTNRLVAALLAVEAQRSVGDALSRSALLGTFSQSPSLLGYRFLPGTGALNAAAVPRTERAVVADASGRLGVLGLTTGTIRHPFGPPPAGGLGGSVLRVSDDGDRVAQLLSAPRDPTRCGSYASLVERDGRGCTVLVVHDIGSGRRVLGPVVTPFAGSDVAISSDGSLVAVAGGLNGDLSTYDVAARRRLGTLSGLRRPEDVFEWRDTAAVAFDADDHLYLGSLSGPIREVDPRSLRVRSTIAAPPLSSHDSLHVSQADLLIATGDRRQVAVDIDTRRLRWTVDLGAEPSSGGCPFFAVMGDRTFCGDDFGRIVERVVLTGQPTGVRLDPQLGSVGDLIVSGAHQNELVAFAAGGVSTTYTRWNIELSGLARRVLSYEGESSIGFDPSGGYLYVDGDENYGPRLIFDVATVQPVADAPDAPHLAWAGPGTLAYWGPSGSGLFDVESQRTRTSPGIGPGTDQVFTERDGLFAWSTEANEAGAVVRRFSLSAGQGVDLELSVPGRVQSLAQTSGGDFVLVTYAGDEDWETALFNVATGRREAVGLAGQSRIAVSPDGVLVAGDPSGALTEFDPDDLSPVASLPGSRGGPSSLQFDNAGDLLVVTTGDQTVHLYDVETRTRLGELDAAAPDGMVEGWLKPDGTTIAVNDHTGVFAWTLDPEELAERACTLAGRNMTRTEWATYMDGEPYRRTCPEFPGGV